VIFLTCAVRGAIQSGEMSAPGLAVGTVAPDKGITVSDQLKEVGGKPWPERTQTA
jgi:hypothetical protein